MYLGAGNVKRVLQIFRGARHLKFTNDESFGVKSTGKAQRRSATAEGQKTIDQFYQYSAVVAHRDVSGERAQFKVLWSDSSVTWVDAKSFTRDVVRSEGANDNVITRYDKELAAKVKRTTAKARSQSNQA